MKQIHLFKKGLVIFLKGAPFSEKLHTLRYTNPLSAILEDFLSIRFKPHQVVGPRRIQIRLSSCQKDEKKILILDFLRRFASKSTKNLICMECLMCHKIEILRVTIFNQATFRELEPGSRNLLQRGRLQRFISGNMSTGSTISWETLDFC